MSSALSIPLYREINECHAACGFPIRTDLPEVHIFSLDEIYPGTRQAMPPYRRGFYQVTFLESLGDSLLRLESEASAGDNPALLFAAPEHALSWVRGERERGYTLYFKVDLLLDQPRPLEATFPFFDRLESNALALTRDDVVTFLPQLERLHALFNSTHPYRRQQLAALTTALLYDCRALFDRRRVDLTETCPDSTLVTRFLQLIWQCSLSDRVVEDYAACLHVSADHLSATLKEHTGRTSREFIADRVVHEAKRLLLYTDFTIGEVAEHLQFSEPTHFTRFFKRHTQYAPLEFRRQNASLSPFAAAAAR